MSRYYITVNDHKGHHKRNEFIYFLSLRFSITSLSSMQELLNFDILIEVDIYFCKEILIIQILIILIDMELVDAIVERLNLDDLGKIKIIANVSDKIGAKPGRLIFAILALLVLFLVLEYGVFWIVLVVGFLYPAYMTFRTIESEEIKQEDAKLWLAYWVVFSTMSVLDRVLSLVFAIIPFFNAIKIAFIIWLFHPKSKGAIYIYDKFIKTYLKIYESQIENVISIFKEKINEAVPIVHDVAQGLKKKDEKETAGRRKVD